MWASVASAALLAVAAPLLLTTPPTLAAAQPVNGGPEYVRVCISEATLRAEAAEVGNVMRRARVDEQRVRRFVNDVTNGLTANQRLRDDDDEDDDEDDDDDDNVERQTLSIFSAIPGQPGVFCFRQEAAANFIVDRYLASGGREVDEDDLDDDDDDEVGDDDRMAVAPAALAAPPTAAARGTTRRPRRRLAAAAAAAGVSPVRRVAAALLGVARPRRASFCKGVCCGLAAFATSFKAPSICQGRGRCQGLFQCPR